MDFYQKQQIDARLGIGPNVSPDVKRNLLIQKINEARPYVQTSREAVIDCDLFTAYLKDIDIEIQVARANQAQANNYYGGQQTQYAPPPPPYGYGSPNNNTYNNVGVAPQHQQQQPNHMPDSNHVDRYSAEAGAKVEPPKQMAQQQNHIPNIPVELTIPDDGHYISILATSNMSIVKEPTGEPGHYVNVVTFKDKNGETIDSVGNEYSILDFSKEDDEILSNDYKQVLIDKYHSLATKKDFIIAEVNYGDLYPVKNKIMTEKTLNGDVMKEYILNTKKLEEYCNGNAIVTRLLRRRIVNIFNTYIAIGLNKPRVIVEKVEDISALLRKFTSEATTASLEQRALAVEVAVESTAAYISNQILGSYPNDEFEPDLVETFKDTRSFVALYTEHEDFINLDFNNTFITPFIKGKTIIKPHKLMLKYHSGMKALFKDYKSKYITFRLITPENSFDLITDGLSGNVFYVVPSENN